MLADCYSETRALLIMDPPLCLGPRWQSLQRDSETRKAKQSHKPLRESLVLLCMASRQTGPFPLTLIIKGICRAMPMSFKKTLSPVGSLTATLLQIFIKIIGKRGGRGEGHCGSPWRLCLFGTSFPLQVSLSHTLSVLRSSSFYPRSYCCSH